MRLEHLPEVRLAHESPLLGKRLAGLQQVHVAAQLREAVLDAGHDDEHEIKTARLIDRLCPPPPLSPSFTGASASRVPG